MSEHDMDVLRSRLSDEQRALLKERMKGARAGSAGARAIPRRAHQGTAPLSFTQQRLWFLCQLQPDGASYNLPAHVRLVGRLDVEALEDGLNQIVRRHEVLRTTFVMEGEEPVQRIAPELRLPLPVLDLGGLPEAEREAEARRLAAEQGREPFDLRAGPLLRARLLRCQPEEHILLLTIHHIIADGWALGLIVRELTAFYRARVGGQPAPADELPIQYADFAVWQRELFRGGGLDAQLSYWKEQLHEPLPVLQLPADRPRPAAQSLRGARSLLLLPVPLAEGLSELSRREGSTLFMTLLALYGVLLRRHTGQEDLIVGTPIANRNRPEISGLVGCFINTLALRLKVSGELTFRQLLAHVREVALAAYANQDLPFEKLVEELRLERAANWSPVFQVMFGLQNAPMPPLDMPGLQLSLFEVEGEATNFDLSFSALETQDTVRCSLTYSTDLFDRETAERMLRHFRTLAEEVTADPDRPVHALQMLGDDERRRLLVEWNATQTPYPADPCLHELFEAQAARTPDALALVYEGEALSYRELNARANQLARHLRLLGVGPESVVGVCMDRSTEMVVSLLAVLKAGGAYLPLDPAYPQQRLTYMLADARAGVVLTQRRLVEAWEGQALQVVCPDAEWETIARQDDGNLRAGAAPENAAYVIYTSGSTGQPKGVMNRHAGVVNRLLWMQDAYGLTADDRVLQKTPYSFDVSVWEFFWPLLCGARLVLARPGGHMESDYLVRLIAEQRITTLHFVPSMLQVFLQEPGLESCDALRRVICSGESLPADLAQRFFTRSRAELHNLYGPTEAAIDVTFWHCRPGRDEHRVPIGRPIANTQIYVLDERGQPVPVGVAGELHIGGVGLARGYVNQPVLTAEKFVPDPFAAAPGGARLYRTGDLARYRPDGAIEFLGRLDYQVKVRGFRIELEEIESVLNQHGDVRESVVMVSEGGDDRIVAYVVPAAGREAAAGELRRYVKERLPEHMVPSGFVLLDELPLTANGKLDRRALRGMEGSRADEAGQFVAPRTPVEEELAAMWADVLGVRRVGIHDNFFELGGHSLLLTQLVSRIRNNFEVEIPLRVLFDTPTVVGMTQAIAEAQMAQEDQTEMERMMEELKNLSPEEVKALLEAESL